MQSSKTVVITGASSGIGLALATAFAGNGARVVANSRHISQSHTLTPSCGSRSAGRPLTWTSATSNR